MAKELLVNVSRGEEVRVALVEDGRLEEIYLERDSAASNVGNIYLGKVTNVEGSIQAAFVDFGYGRNGFLHVQDLHPDYFPEGGRWDKMTERVGKKIGRRDRPPIQDCLRRGDQIIVQIIKEGIGTKGPTLTSYPSIPGRFLVMMPGVRQMGVSKNIEDEDERRRLRKILDGLSPPKDVGFIIRTAGAGKTKTELERDFKYLSRLWEEIERTKKGARPPTLLYSEGDLVTRTVRDVWTSDIERVLVDDVETALQIRQFFKLLMPRTKVNVQLYQGEVPLFHATGVEAEIETMFSRHVPMTSGASLVIDSTEAIIAIDVNSGKFRIHDDAEETAFRTDMEAAEEICRQLRLRDLGGLVIVDFIDLRYARHRQALFDRLTELFKRDRAKSRHLEMNEFGIVSITRQRMRPDLKKSVFMPCPWSNGTGVIKTPESMALDVMRRLRVAAADERVTRIVISLYPSAALHVLNSKRQPLAELERNSGAQIEIRQDDTIAADAVAMEMFDERDGQVVVDTLAERREIKPDSGGKRRRRRGKGRDEADTEAAAGGGAAGRDGLIELSNLVPLANLSLEETEKLLGELLDNEARSRSVASHDPRAVVLQALQSGDLGEDEEGEEPGRREAPADGEGKKKRRRRRRRGGRDQAESTDGQPETPAEAEAEEAEEQPGPQEAVEPAPQPDGADDDQRPRRRRRRRGRRSETAEAAETTDTAAAERHPVMEPGDADQPVEEPEDEPEGAEREEDLAFDDPYTGMTPDERLDAQVNGNRIDRETHVMSRDPFTHRREERDEPPDEPRRKRRRRKRGKRDSTAVGQAGGGDGERFTAPAPERREATPAPRVPAADEEAAASAREPSQEGDAEPRRRRRRRRRRGGGRSEQDAPVAGAVVKAPPETQTPEEILEESAPEATVEAEEDTKPVESETPRRRRRRGKSTSRASSETADESQEAVEAPVAAEPADEEPATSPVKKTTRKTAKKTTKKTAKKGRKKASPKTAPKKSPRKRAKKAEVADVE